MEHLPQPVARCIETLREAGFAAYPVGGCVRDLLLGRAPGDWDIATAALPQAVMGLFPRTCPTGLSHGTVTVLLDGMALEVTTFRAEGRYSDGRHPDGVTFGVSLEEDLARRDFTVNAMALAPDGTVIDPFGGRRDLSAGRIACVGEPARRFGEDALRMFRAVRFAAQLDFAIDPATAAAIPPLAHRAGLLAGERVYSEVEKTLCSPRPDMAGLLLDWGLLAAPRRPDLAALCRLPAEALDRWQGFCRLTGFGITTLPVPRRIREGVLHPQRRAVAALAVTGGELAALGLRGPEIGAAQRYLARYVAERPEANCRVALLAALDGWRKDPSEGEDLGH